MKIAKVWGSEEIIVNNKDYCGKILTIFGGFISSYHCHKKKTETFYVLKGEVILDLGDKSRENIKRYYLQEGTSITINPGQYHFFTSRNEAKFLEISTHHKDSDSYRETESRRL